jgi:phage internal scaffolding protein
MKAASDFIFRTPYDGKARDVSDATGVDASCAPGETVQAAQQQFIDMCDVNQVVAKYRVTGLVRVREAYARGSYSDLSTAPDYHAAMNIVAAADQAFMQLPAALRARFNNNASDFLAFLDDPKNADEMLSLGLAVRKGSDALAHEAGGAPLASGASAPLKPTPPSVASELASLEASIARLKGNPAPGEPGA